MVALDWEADGVEAIRFSISGHRFLEGRKPSRNWCKALTRGVATGCSFESVMSVPIQM
jgi:hypothetical protein